MGNIERYFPVVKTQSNLKQKDTTKKSASRYTPYQAPTAPTPRDVKRPSAAALNKFLLSTLKDVNNPITHPTSGMRVEHVESTATGHQRSESVMNRTLYLKHQREKLKKQEERPEPPTSTPTSSAKPPSKIQLSGSASSASTNSSAGAAKADEPPKTKKLVMAGVRVYINGYLCDTTDIEMKRTVTLAGGQVLLTPSNATHILTSQGLNGSKSHKHLTKNSRTKIHIVKPEWVVDSINVGKRLPERHYTVVTNHTIGSVAKMFGERPYERPLPPSP